MGLWRRSAHPSANRLGSPSISSFFFQHPNPSSVRRLRRQAPEQSFRLSPSSQCCNLPNESLSFGFRDPLQQSFVSPDARLSPSGSPKHSVWAAPKEIPLKPLLFGPLPACKRPSIGCPASFSGTNNFWPSPPFDSLGFPLFQLLFLVKIRLPGSP